MIASPGWRLYYGDGTTADGVTPSDWKRAPARNVQALVTPDDTVGREVDHSKGYYLWWPDAPKPWGVDAAGLWDFLHEIRHAEAGKPLSAVDFDALLKVGVKYGRSIANDAFRAIMRRASTDPDFLAPAKYATSAHEGRDG